MRSECVPIAKLTHEQTMYHFISGYTAKLAGTEVGIKEPSATFSACSGPFMPLTRVSTRRRPANDSDATAASRLVNTGWTGGPYGVGHRMNINHTRQMVRAALNGALDDVETARIRSSASRYRLRPRLPDEVLWPRDTWADADAFDAQARKLAAMFVANFKGYEDGVDASLVAVGPKAG